MPHADSGSRPPARSISASLARDGLPLAAFAGLAVLATYPILSAPRSTILGWPGDNVQFVYVTGWIAEALRRGVSPFVDPHLNYPGTLALTATDVPFVEMFAAAPLTWAFGPVFGYNAIILASHVLTGYVPYRWILSLSGSRAGGVVAGTAFLLSPFRIGHSYGHLMLVATFVVPLFFWALDNALRRDRSPRRLLSLALAAALVGGTSQYVLVICLVTGAAYASVVLLGPEGRNLRPALGVAAAVVAGALVGALPYLVTLDDRVYAPHDPASTRLWSAEPARFLVPSPRHPLWGDLVDGEEPAPLWIEKTLYVGIVPAALALIGLRHANPAGRRVVWVATALVAAVFALGTDLHVGGKPLHESDPLHLPAYYLSQVPVLDLLRVWSRFGVVTILFVALLAGVGAATLCEWLPRWRRPVLALVGFLVIVDLLPGTLISSTLVPRRIDRWLAAQPGDFAVAFLPNEDALNYQNMFGSLVHGKRLPAHNHPVHRPPEYADFARRAAAFPDPRSIAALRALGFRYLLLQRSSFDGVSAPEWRAVLDQLVASPDLAILGEVDGFLAVRFD